MKHSTLTDSDGWEVVAEDGKVILWTSNLYSEGLGESFSAESAAALGRALIACAATRSSPVR